MNGCWISGGVGGGGGGEHFCGLSLYFLTIERLRFTFTAKGKCQTQVEKFSE